MNPNYPERLRIAHLPTAVEPLTRLSKHLGGPDLAIKRDDQTGLATGGNKTRKLEFLVAAALAQGCDHLVTTGAPQSNHCRQTAAAAARHGLGCTVVLSGEKPEIITGNLLLDKLLGAHVYWAGERPRPKAMNQATEELQEMGRKPYQIPLGGSNVLGATGYVLAMKELTEQLSAEGRNIDAIVFASSSGGTQAGIALGAEIYGFQGQILGVSVDHPADAVKAQVTELAAATAVHLGLGNLSVADRINVNDDYLGGGYAVIGETEREAVRMVAELEGILLDPVYTGRAMGGLIDLIRQGVFTRDQNVLFWHTGGAAALPAFVDKLIDAS
ncbi:MAG: D-cysteine desulfhydrase family protein [Chloroflexi bacterium]|nr:D-cysteine desulfhydrase family protein [Chloroflexota bacterium]